MSKIFTASIKLVSILLKKWFIGNLKDTEIFAIIRTEDGKDKIVFHLPDAMVYEVVKWAKAGGEGDLLKMIVPALINPNRGDKIVLVSSNMKDPSKSDDLDLGNTITGYIYRALMSESQED